MNRNFPKFFSTLFFTFVFLFSSTVVAQNEKPTISDTDSLRVILKVLSIYDWKAEAEEERKIYFSNENFPKYVSSKFPKKLGDFDVYLMPENQFNKKLKYDIHRIIDLRINGNTAFVTFMIDFADGCQGGTNYKLGKKKGKWEIKSRDSFATSC